MLKCLSFSSRLYFVGAVLIAVPVIADAPTPSQEFWEYMAEYGDDNGDVLDPLEFDQIIGMKETDITSAKEMAADVDVPIDKPKARNADMKFEQKSSSQNSSAGMKGATL
jgi:hypothetical protein